MFTNDRVGRLLEWHFVSSAALGAKAESWWSGGVELSGLASADRSSQRHAVSGQKECGGTDKKWPGSGSTEASDKGYFRAF